MYSALIFTHVLSVLGFLMAHGASAAVMFRLRVEREPSRLCALLDLSQAVGGAMALTALVLFVSGLALGFIGAWWSSGWIWASLGLFLAISIVMSWQGRMYFERVRRALGAETRAAAEPGMPRVLPPAALATVLASGRPMLLAGVGLGGLAVITALMMFKPF